MPEFSAFLVPIQSYNQWCSRKYLGTGAVRNIGIINMILLLERARRIKT